MAFNDNDWVVESIDKITFAPIEQSQRIKDINNPSETVEFVRKGINLTTSRVGYYDGSQWIHYFDANGDAQLKWQNNFNQVVKDTKYPISLSRVNGESYVSFSIELSTADDPTFKLYNSSNTLLATMNLINSGNTNKVFGSVEFVKFPNGTLVNAIYSYLKNTTMYHENQNVFIADTVTNILFSSSLGYNYTSNSYCKITNK